VGVDKACAGLETPKQLTFARTVPDHRQDRYFWQMVLARAGPSILPGIMMSLQTIPTPSRSISFRANVASGAHRTLHPTGSLPPMIISNPFGIMGCTDC
jgi:hypothetical protein